MTPFQQAQAMGLVAMTGARAGARRYPAHAAPAGGPVAFGFTAPTIIYDEIRLIDSDAGRLNTSIMQSVQDPNFRAQWQRWFSTWEAFRDKHLDSIASKLAAAFTSDDLARQVEGQRQQLAGWFQAYQTQTGPGGGAVPGIPGLAAPQLSPGQTTSPDGGSTSILPWWAWTLVGVAAVGGGYFLYRKYVAVQQTKKTLYREVLPKFVGKGMARAAEHANSDAIPEEDVPPWMQHDPDGLDAYARDPRAHMRYEPPVYRAPPPPMLPPRQQGVYYRPYDHPHLVAMRDRHRATFARGWGRDATDEPEPEDYDE